MSRSHRGGTLLALAASSLALVACGGGEKAAPLSITASQSGKDFSVEAPKSIPAGLVKITFKNDGKKPADLQLVRVDGDHSPKEVLKVIQSEDGAPTPPWLHGAGGTGFTPPGKTTTSTQVLEPGRYQVLDLGGQGEDAPTNASKGAVTSLAVTGAKKKGELPSTDAKITMKEYSFKAEGLKPGPNKVTIENSGKELHHIVAAPIRPGATPADIQKFIKEEGESKGPPPLDFEKGTNTPVLDAGQKQVLQLDLKPGKYELLCFISDRKGGPPHVAKGQVAQVEVKK